MQKTILVVEDTEDSRHVLKIVLEMFGFLVIEAADGSEAVKSVSEHRPDLILMDISMPVMDGLTATKAIRKFDGTAKIPIIAVTAHGNQFYKSAIEAGCNDLISKPIDFNTLQPVIEQYMAY
ncbi:MAG: response regulator [Acidobacteriota bacterium]|jgi:CheY-like chemotaxis protein|nr:response regulator [Acidobacteriota bacterium]